MSIGPAVLGIDPSQTAAGVAIIAGGPRHINWPVLVRDVGDAGHRADPWTRRARRIVAQVRRIMALVDDAALKGADYRLAAIEAPAYANKLPSQYDRAGIFWGLVSALDTRKIPIAVIAPQILKMFATGIGNADKKLVLAETRALWAPRADWVTIANDNQADALTLATMGTMHLRWSMPFNGAPRRRHVENVAKCEWPEVTVDA